MWSTASSALATWPIQPLIFFFQAEDGIRDHCVTGVQTCALPICAGARGLQQAREVGRVVREVGLHLDHVPGAAAQGVGEAVDVGQPEPRLAGAVQDLDGAVAGGDGVRQRARAVGRGVVDDEDPGLRHALADGVHERLEVLGLVVGGDDDPGRAGHARPRSLRTRMSDLTNAQIAAAFDELGDLYELDGAVSYRVIAYRNAARAVRESSVSVAAMTREGRVTDVPGIGRTLEEKLRALAETGDIPAAQKLRAKFPPGLIAVMHLPGFGPKRARRLYDELGVDSLDSLRAAAEAGKIRGLRGFGAKVEENLKQTLAEQENGGGPAPRVLLSRAMPVAEQIVGVLRAHPASDRVEVAGSLRRRADAVKDLDIIATASDPKALAGALGDLDLVESVQQSGDAGARVTLHTGMKVDLKVVEPDQFGNVLQHFTGSKAHNVALRESAVRRGLHVSEYGILDDATGETLRCSSEEEVYAARGLPWIPPELREGRGELEAALLDGGTGLPRLIEVEDLKGDLHSHTTLSGGRNSLQQMGRGAMDRGLEYLAITDHSA